MQTADPLLGTRGEVAVASPAAALAVFTETAVFDEVRRLETLFTVFDETSALYALRRTGSTDVPELQTVVELALDWHQRTNGAFHPAIQPLFDVWDEAEAQGQLPSPGVLSAAVTAMDASDLGDIDLTGINLNGINLNGIAKGWIVDRALATAFVGNDTAAVNDASEERVTSAWLNVGGDVAHRGDSSLVVGIEDPARPYDNVAPLATIEISNEALATSGGGRRWWTIDGRRYSKVLNPRTGQSAEHIRSATVVASTAESADVLATTCLVLEPDEAIAIVQAEHAECFLIRSDGTIVSSSPRFQSELQS